MCGPYPNLRYVLSFTVLLCLSLLSLNGQTSGQWGVCEFATPTQMNSYSPGSDNWACKIAYVTESNSHYQWDGTAWVQMSARNIFEDNGSLTNNRFLELASFALTFAGVDSVTINADGLLGIGTTSPDHALHVVADADPVKLEGLETSEEDSYLVVNSDGVVKKRSIETSSKIFYPPAIALDASATDTELTLDLHQEYVDRFGTPAVVSSGAPSAIPTYDADELYYYITDYDSSVLDNVSLDDEGVMTYDIIATPTGNCTVLNIVFVVK